MAASTLSTPMTLKVGSETKIPRLVYGTAWKGEKTADLVYRALKAGFRGVDTAAQPKHYQEALVGDGIKRAIEDGIVERKDVFVRPSSIPGPLLGVKGVLQHRGFRTRSADRRRSRRSTRRGEAKIHRTCPTMPRFPSQTKSIPLSHHHSRTSARAKTPTSTACCCTRPSPSSKGRPSRGTRSPATWRRGRSDTWA